MWSYSSAMDYFAVIGYLEIASNSIALHKLPWVTNLVRFDGVKGYVTLDFFLYNKGFVT